MFAPQDVRADFGQGSELPSRAREASILPSNVAREQLKILMPGAAAGCRRADRGVRRFGTRSMGAAEHGVEMLCRAGLGSPG